MTEEPRQFGPAPAARQCGPCSKCCEGWLHGSAHGIKFWKGRPCHFLTGNACSIYPQRPVDPCQAFACEWLRNDRIPGWMRPDQINAIVVRRRINDVEFLELNESGDVMRSDVLSWMILHCLNEKINLLYYVKGGENRIGSKSFLELNVS